jgi:hypothetical protein
MRYVTSFLPTRWIAATAVALLAATLAQPAAAQWKWRDKGGQVQYSDLPPPSGVSDADILQRPISAQRKSGPAGAAPAAAASAASAAPAATLTPRTVEPELEAKRKKAEQDETDKRKAEEQRLAAVRLQNCISARTHLQALLDGQRIVRTNERGEREVLDDKGRADDLQRTRALVASECGK